MNQQAVARVRPALHPLPTQKYLIDCFEIIGSQLFWKERPREHFKSNAAYLSTKQTMAGRQVKTISNGYVVVSLIGTVYQAARIVFKMWHNEEPDHVEFIDGDRQNLSPDNLRGTYRVRVDPFSDK